MFCFALVYLFFENVQVASNLLNNRVKFLYGKGDYDGLRDSFKEVYWNCLLDDSMSMEDVWSVIVNIIKNGIDKFVPRRNISGRSVHQRKTVSYCTRKKKSEKAQDF